MTAKKTQLPGQERPEVQDNPDHMGATMGGIGGVGSGVAAGAADIIPTSVRGAAPVGGAWSGVEGGLTPAQALPVSAEDTAEDEASLIALRLGETPPAPEGKQALAANDVKKPSDGGDRKAD